MTGRVQQKDHIKTQINSQIVTMFIAPGIDESTKFEAQTRKEIGVSTSLPWCRELHLTFQAIEWVRLTDLPTWTGKKPKKVAGVKEKKFYNVTPFVG